MPPTDMRVDIETAWVKLKTLGPVVTMTAAAVFIYMRFEQRMNEIEKSMARDVELRSLERRELKDSVDGVRSDLRKVFVDSVATRQAQQWIEMARALNQEKYPNLKWPDLPR